MKDVLFSVIVPVYNREACIHLAVDSICAQKYADWELVLVDDGSTDSTGEICRNYTAKDSRVRYFRKENGGVSAARNFGLREVRGDYILFLDSDDALAPGCLGVLNKRIGEQASAPDMVCFGTAGGSAVWKPTECMEGEIVPKDRIRNCYLPTHINIYPQNKNFLLNYIWNKCYRADFVRKDGLWFDEGRRTWEDGMFVVNCLDRAQSLLLIPEALHVGCVDGTVEHLSAKFYDSQIMLYIRDETEFKDRFAGEFDFASVHYCHSNLDTLNVLFTTAFKTHGKKAGVLMESVAKYPIVLHWVTNAAPRNSYERFLRSCVAGKKYRWIVWFYRVRAAKHKVFKCFR